MFTKKRFLKNKLYQFIYLLVAFFQIGYLFNYRNLQTRISTGHTIFLVINLALLLGLSVYYLFKQNKNFFGIGLLGLNQFFSLLLDYPTFYYLCTTGLFIIALAHLKETVILDYYYYKHLKDKDLSFLNDLLNHHINSEVLSFNMLDETTIEFKTKDDNVFYVKRLENDDLLFLDQGNLCKKHKVSIDEFHTKVPDIDKGNPSQVLLRVQTIEDNEVIFFHTNIMDIRRSLLFYLDLLYEMEMCFMFESDNESYDNLLQITQSEIKKEEANDN